jgi:hypothetical protein
MPTRENEARSYLFTVRVWPEAVGDDRVEWRGKVQHVTSGEALFFRDWRSLVEFLEGALPSKHEQALPPSPDYPRTGDHTEATPVAELDE